MQAKFRVRNEEIAALYKAGELGLRKIGEKYGLTFERVRQICYYYGGLDRQKVKEIMGQRRLKVLIKKYGSLENYEAEQRRKKEIHLRTIARAGKWSRGYDACIDCGRTEREHAGKGRCSPCYLKHLYHNSPSRKAKHKIHVKEWRLRNIEKVKAYQAQYIKEYLARPGIKKHKQEQALVKYNDPVRKAKRQAYAKIYYSQPEVKSKRKMHDHLKWLIKKANRKQYERKRKV